MSSYGPLKPESKKESVKLKTYRSVAFLTKALKKKTSDSNYNSTKISYTKKNINLEHGTNKIFSKGQEMNGETTLNTERSGFITERSGLECSGLSCKENPQDSHQRLLDFKLSFRQN